MGHFVFLFTILQSIFACDVIFNFVILLKYFHLKTAQTSRTASGDKKAVKTQIYSCHKSFGKTQKLGKF